MLSYAYNATVGKFLAPGPANTEEVAEVEARSKEDPHAQQFDEKSRLQRAMKVHKTDASIPYTATDQKSLVTKEEIPGVPEAFILHNVLTPEECEAYIQITEQLGYTEAPITTGIEKAEMIPDVRDNLRVMWEASEALTNPIWERVAHLIPDQITMNHTYRVNETQPLNDRFRFYRYDINQAFKPHFDGCYRKNSEEFSHFTFIIYLNGGFSGGETVFFPGGKNSLWSGRVVTTEKRVNPRRGSALLFRHTGTNSPLHEGAPHFSNGERKYVLRSDIMYKQVGTD